MLEKLKVLIVDDEESTRALIRMSIDWEELGYSVVGEANNAEEALEYLEVDLPDLVLTDIYMPYMDGLELSERILSQYPDVKVVVITGHDNFEYAQRGIKAGVFDFILKPIDEDEIEKTLISVYSLIESEREMKASYNWLVEQLEKERPYLKEKFLVDLLYNHIDEQDYIRKKNFTGIHTKSICFQVTVIEIAASNPEELSIEQQGPYLCYLFIDYIRTAMAELPGVEAFIDNTNNIVLLNSDNGNTSEMNKRLELIKRHVLRHPGIGVTIGIGGWYEGINRIKISYKEATEALSYKIVSGINQIINYDDLVISVRNENRLSETWQDKLSLYIKGGIEEEALKLTEQVFDEMMYHGNIQIKSFRLKAIQLVMLIIGAMTEIGMNIEDKKATGEEPFEAIFKGIRCRK